MVDLGTLLDEDERKCGMPQIVIDWLLKVNKELI
jgi:hypothetical protein